MNVKLPRKKRQKIYKFLYPLFSLASAVLISTIALIAMTIFGIYFHIWIPSLL